MGRSVPQALVVGLHKVVQRSLPVTLVGAGLPQIAELAGDAKSYAERLFKFPEIGNLDAPSAREALSGPARAEDASFDDLALERALEVTGRYPYFIQELGSAAWGVAEGPRITLEDIEQAEQIYQSRLDTSFWDVASVMGKQSTQVAPFRAELIAMGLLYTPEHGYAAFTVPHFDRYMKRIIPTFSMD